MTLRQFYTRLSKIIDEEGKTNPDILDKNIVLSVMPCTAKADDIARCGTYGICQVILEEDYVRITNYI